jgi:hypothetical protein
MLFTIEGANLQMDFVILLQRIRQLLTQSTLTNLRQIHLIMIFEAIQNMLEVNSLIWNIESDCNGRD